MFIQFSHFIFRELQKTYLDVLSWLIKMESNLTIDDSSEAKIFDGVMRKTSLLLTVRLKMISSVNFSRNLLFVSFSLLGTLFGLFTFPYDENSH